MSAVGGSVLRIWESRLRTYSSDSFMSADQSKKTLMAADPRAVVDRILTVPGMYFIASSTGRVTVA